METGVKRAFLLALAVALLFVSAAALDPLQQMRRDYDLTSEPVKGLSPGLALATQVLGWGRGLIIDVLWIRMESLKQHDRLFELVQLADWACKLAPRFPFVWDFQAWNLAYNVGSQIEHLPDRWPWVRRGIELLRDEGIPLNPNSPMLYERLAWIIWHKIGEQDDNANVFYKQQFGLYMHEILGGPGDRETLQEFAAAPKTKEELLRDPAVKALWEECNKYGFDIVDGFFAWYQERPSVPEAVKDIVARPQSEDAMHKIAVYARARRLKEECKLDVNRMLALGEKYADSEGRPAPFDWRTPFPHAIYWASVGLERLDALEKRTEQKRKQFNLPDPLTQLKTRIRDEGETYYEFDRVSLQRIIYGAMQSLVEHGRLLYDAEGHLLLDAGPDYRFADATLPLYKQVIEAHGKRYAIATRDALRYFLIRGVFEFQYMGATAKSMKYFKMLKEEFPKFVGNRTYDEFYDWRRKKYTEDMTSDQVRRLLRGKLLRAWIAIACNQDEAAAVLQAEAKEFADKWNAQQDYNLRSRVRYKVLNETALLSLLSGRYRISPVAYENLQNRLRQQNPELLDRMMKIVKGPPPKPKPEQVEKGLEMETH